MPVNFLPLFIPVLIVVGLIVTLMRGKRGFKFAVMASVSIIVLVTLPFYIHGWLLMAKAYNGDAASQYKLAKWYENHCENINTAILFPCEPDIESGFEWLEKSADQDYPPALYSLGVRLKYETFVFHQGLSINRVVQQSEKGQFYIDRAVSLGYKPFIDEKLHYWQVFRETHFSEDL